MEYTQNYQLPLWDKEDAVIRTDFNENNQKIDAAIAAVASAVDGLIVTGTYVGNATDETEQAIELGFRPRFLLVRNTDHKGSNTSSGNTWTLTSLAIAFSGYDHYYSEDIALVCITDTGFTVGGSTVGFFNKSGTTYTYLAIR